MHENKSSNRGHPEKVCEVYLLEMSRSPFSFFSKKFFSPNFQFRFGFYEFFNSITEVVVETVEVYRASAQTGNII